MARRPMVFANVHPIKARARYYLSIVAEIGRMVVRNICSLTPIRATPRTPK